MNTEEIRHKIQVFRRWQRKPHAVSPLSREEHECKTCKTVFKGNFCPRCGQSSRVSRYSFKSTFLLFIDVWGLGNRGMRHSIRDLLLRPGYMIRDYLQGMQMAYFPPFKMLFLLTALSLLVESGMNIRYRNFLEERMKEKTTLTEANKKTDKQVNEKEEDAVGKFLMANTDNILQTIIKTQERYPNISQIFGLLLLACPWYLFLRNGPSYPGMHFSEFFVATVYSSNMITIYSIVFTFFGIRFLNPILSALIIIPMKQLTGYKWSRVIFSLILVTAILLLFVTIAIFTIALVWSAFTLHGSPAG